MKFIGTVSCLIFPVTPIGAIFAITKSISEQLDKVQEVVDIIETERCPQIRRWDGMLSDEANKT